MRAADPLMQAKLERHSVQAIGAPYDLISPALWRAPVIFASPHSGRIYPESFLKRAACDLKTLRLNEDAHLDSLFEAVIHHGAPLLSARFPRCFVDVNRAPDELPPSWRDDGAASLTARAEAGFGVIPLMIAKEKPIYLSHPPREIALERLKYLYDPYHKALTSLIERSIARFGRAIIIDCHSMPGFAAMGARRADIVLGDRYGLSCSAATISAVERAFVQAGYQVKRNSPYAGGYVTTHYGRSAQDPQRASETVQIEINRDLYLNPVTLELKPHHYQTLLRNLDRIILQIMTDFEEKNMAAAE